MPHGAKRFDAVLFCCFAVLCTWSFSASDENRHPFDNQTDTVTSYRFESPVLDNMAEFVDNMILYMHERNEEKRLELEILNLPNAVTPASLHSDTYNQRMQEVFHYAMMKYYVEHCIAQDVMMHLMIEERKRKRNKKKMIFIA